MADTVIIVNADGSGNYLNLTDAITGEATIIGEGNRLIFECEGQDYSFSSVINLENLGYDGTGEIVIRGNVTDPYILDEGYFTLEFTNTVMIDAGAGPVVAFENLHLRMAVQNYNCQVITNTDNSETMLGATYDGCILEYTGNMACLTLENKSVTTTPWVYAFRDSVATSQTGEFRMVSGGYAQEIDGTIERSTLDPVVYVSNVDNSAGASLQVIDTAINLTGSDYDVGDIDATYINCSGPTAIGTGHVLVSDFDSQFEGVATGDYTLVGNSILLGEGSTGNNIGADQVSVATLPIINFDNPTPNDGDAVSFTVSNLTGTITVATLAGVDILPILSDTDVEANLSFTVDLYAMASAATGTSLQLPRIGLSSDLYLETSEGVAESTLTYQPKAGWSTVTATSPDLSDGSFGHSVSQDLGITPQAGDVVYYDTNGNALISPSLNYQSDFTEESEFTPFLYQKTGTSEVGSLSYGAEFYPYQGDLVESSDLVMSYDAPDGSYQAVYFEVPSAGPVDLQNPTGVTTVVVSGGTMTMPTSLSAGTEVVAYVPGDNPPNTGGAIYGVTS